MSRASPRLHSRAGWPHCDATSECLPRHPAVAYDVFFPRKHPSGFPSMSHRFPRAPFSFTHDLPGSLVLSLPLKNRYPRGFSVYPAASQPAVFALSGYPVYLADSQSARFSLDRECAIRKTCHRRNDGRKKSSRAIDGVHLTFPGKCRMTRKPGRA